ncbi:MAG: galactokinase [Clostridiales bacterium]|nr:galactokinase [Clostridiales bacterium]
MDIVRRMDSRAAQRALERLYGERADKQLWRYKALAKKFAERFGREDFKFFSAPGRTEILGNHTDHNGGRVLAGSINLDTIAAASPRGDGKITVNSEGFDREFCLELSELGPVYSEQGTTNGLIRGIAARFKQLGMNIGGFDACIMSDVLRGSGLSSSASVEVLICQIFSQFYNDGKVSVMDIAQISQYAENQYFGKPCGLMDQLACACGGVVAIDFNEALMPECESVKYDFARKGYSLIITDVREDHADLTGEYAAITEEMGQICAHFGVKRLCELEEKAFYASLHELHQAVPDRAILRGIHFFEENKRVQRGIQALKKDRLPDFFREVILSGESSWRLLQNLYKPGSIKQSLPLALAASELLLKEDGAWRVHGGGFGGTIMAFVPNAQRKIYIGQMNRLFGEGAAVELCVRPIGAVCLEM